MKEQTACFTGHRKIPLEEYKTISQRLEKEIIVSINNGYRFFGSGGALGFDTLAARTVLKLKAFIRIFGSFLFYLVKIKH